MRLIADRWRITGKADVCGFQSKLLPNFQFARNPAYSLTDKFLGKAAVTAAPSSGRVRLTVSNYSSNNTEGIDLVSISEYRNVAGSIPVSRSNENQRFTKRLRDLCSISALFVLGFALTY
jgi:hypothetical protein